MLEMFRLGESPSQADLTTAETCSLARARLQKTFHESFLAQTLRATSLCPPLSTTTGEIAAADVALPPQLARLQAKQLVSVSTIYWRQDVLASGQLW